MTGDPALHALEQEVTKALAEVDAIRRQIEQHEKLGNTRNVKVGGGLLKKATKKFDEARERHRQATSKGDDL